MPIQYKLQFFILFLLVTLINVFITASTCLSSCSGPNHSTAFGYASVASANYSTALGSYNQSTNYGSLAVGYGIFATGHSSVAVGLVSSSPGNHSIAIGPHSLSSGYYSTVVGSHAVAFGNSSTAIGNGSSVAGVASTILGGSSNIIYTDANYSTIVGGSNNIINTGVSNSCAIGNNINIINTGSFVWSDGSSLNSVVSNGDNSFTIYASGGIFFKKRAIRGKKISDGSGGAMALEIRADGKIIENVSSRRYKRDIESIEEGETENLYNLEPIKFYYNNNQSTGSKEFGLIAEDVEKYYKELVVYNEDGEPESVKYRVLPVLMLNELKKLKTSINKLQLSNEELKKDHENLQINIQNISANHKLEIQDLKNYIRTLKEI